MKVKRSLKEIGVSLCILGVSMILFPTFFDEGTKFKQTVDESMITGFVLIAIGFIVFWIKRVLDKRREKGLW